MRRVVSVVAAVLFAIVGSAVEGPHAGAGSLAHVGVWWLYNDTPWYEFAGTSPTRNEPLGVWALEASRSKKALEFDITEVVRFAPDDAAISGRLGFYSEPSDRVMTYGGIEFSLDAKTGRVDVTLVERESEGTSTSPEVWSEADEDFADVTGSYRDVGVHIVIKPTGSYRRLLRDPLTSLGFDLWTGESGTNVQPSARVSIGDLTGTKPGLFPQQGTAVAADGTPQPWITQPVADEYSMWRVRGRASAADPQHVTIDIGKYASDAIGIRTFVASEFKPVEGGGRFPAYQLALFTPGQTTGRLRLGDAFLSSEAQSFTIGTQGKTKFTLELSSQLLAGYANVSVVVPGETDAVLLATGLQYKF